MPVTQSVENLLRRGVQVSCPESVEVEACVVPERISPSAILHPGTRLRGAATSIGPGCEIGAEAPATVEDCQLGSKVALKGGYFSGATFLDGASLGSAAHVRPGTLLEEEASGAHAVGLKQTVFLPFVTAGSLINFCDALLAGGTSRKDHSEIGSSYIHFNYTPHQDKATASLIGDVPRGVLLDQPPIFLGGQGGLVGPVRIEYGAVIPAGVICRQDILTPHHLYQAPVPSSAAPRAFHAGAYRAIQRVVLNNLAYIGNLHALQQWYQFVRKDTMSKDTFALACWQGALTQVDRLLEERRQRLKELAEKMPHSLELARQEPRLALPPEVAAQQKRLVDGWPEMAGALQKGPGGEVGVEARDRFLAAWAQVDQSQGHVPAVRQLTPASKRDATDWLQSVVSSLVQLWNTTSK